GLRKHIKMNYKYCSHNSGWRDNYMEGFLYVSHGSRVAEAVEGATSLIERVQAKVNIPLQETCFLELADPDISEGFRKLVHQGATEISVIRLFPLRAGHYYRDIPLEIQRVQPL